MSRCRRDGMKPAMAEIGGFANSGLLALAAEPMMAKLSTRRLRVRLRTRPCRGRDDGMGQHRTRRV
jgi:hypothetical protein